ncbi:MAG: energy transducer TonB [Arcicella sp.]|nr:energy transducer TonB [Arcicella sp.]
MKKLLILSILLSILGIFSFAQPAPKTTSANSKKDSSAVVASKKSSENQTLPITGANKSVSEKSTTTDEEDFDEKELDELEASIAKAKAVLGLKNVLTTTSSKSISSRSKDTNTKEKEIAIKIEESRVTAPTTNYEAPSLTIGGRSTGKARTDFKQAVLSDDEKALYKIGGIQVNNIDDVETDSIYVSPTVPPSFSGGVEAMKLFFAQNLKLPETVKPEDIKGRVFVRFVVRKDGKLDKVHLVKGPNDDCNSEAVRVIKLMPAWIPATDRGDAVSAYHILPISFGVKK